MFSDKPSFCLTLWKILEYTWCILGVWLWTTTSGWRGGSVDENCALRWGALGCLRSNSFRLESFVNLWLSAQMPSAVHPYLEKPKFLMTNMGLKGFQVWGGGDFRQIFNTGCSACKTLTVIWIPSGNHNWIKSWCQGKDTHDSTNQYLMEQPPKKHELPSREHVCSHRRGARGGCW